MWNWSGSFFVNGCFKDWKWNNAPHDFAFVAFILTFNNNNKKNRGMRYGFNIWIVFFFRLHNIPILMQFIPLDGTTWIGPRKLIAFTKSRSIQTISLCFFYCWMVFADFKYAFLHKFLRKSRWPRRTEWNKWDIYFAHFERGEKKKCAVTNRNVHSKQWNKNANKAPKIHSWHIHSVAPIGTKLLLCASHCQRSLCHWCGEFVWPRNVENNMS